MDKIMSYIAQNPIIAVVGAAVLVFLAGMAARRFKIIALVFILIAAFVFYVHLREGKGSKNPIDDIKKKVKTKVMENM